MKIRVALVVLFLSAGVSMADVMTLPLILDSGWDATINDTENVGIVVDAVSTVEDYVVIEIIKTFRDFTPIVIDFQARANAVGTIRISDETIVNLTGVDWTDYHWEIVDVQGGTATFADPGDFSVAPFETKNLTLSTLDAFGGGTVPGNGAVFAPGLNSGPLDIVTDPAGAGPVSFKLVQYPTPEPATMTVLALGGLIALRRRRRKA